MTRVLGGCPKYRRRRRRSRWDKFVTQLTRIFKFAFTAKNQPERQLGFKFRVGGDLDARVRFWIHAELCILSENVFFRDRLKLELQEFHVFNLIELVHDRV
jgi:hypothetical protein